MSASTLKEQMHSRWQAIQDRIAAACQRSGRRSSEVHMIAVTKYGSIEVTQAALDLGLVHIGENRWQDARPKWEALQDKGIWHFIGHLQSNKVKEVVGKFDYIHSLDRLSLATHIDQQAKTLGIQVQAFIQLNVAHEETKFGLAPEDMLGFVKQISSFQHLRIAGLMTMAPYVEQSESTRSIFRQLRLLRSNLNQSGILPYEVSHLSMGMSNDFEVAIEEGATWIRLGSILIGKS